LNLGDLLRFAFGSLFGKRLRTALSLVGMVIGVAAVVILTALGEGARRYVTSQFASIGSNLLIVLPGKTETSGFAAGTVPGVPNDLTLDDAEAVRRQVAGVVRLSPLVVATETVAHGARRRNVAVVGTNREFLELRKLALSQGQFLPPDEAGRGRPVVVLGTKVARELFPGGEEPVGQVVRIGGWRMRVVGILASRGTQLGMNIDDVVAVPVATAMRMFDRRSLFRIMVEVRSTADLDTAKARVIRVVKERHDGEEDITVLTQDALISTFSQILGALTLALGAIAAISLTVAGIGIMNVMLVSVSERTKEVGLLRAVGVGRRQILGVFLTEAAMLSLAGGLLGLAFGWLAVRLLVKLYPALPATPPTWAVLAALGLSLVTGIVFGLLPARRAARLDPVAALAGK
jgi:putative ABC transport system permease protein